MGIFVIIELLRLWRQILNQNYIDDHFKWSEKLDELPEGIIHCAARVGGIQGNMEGQGKFFYENIAMNTAIIAGTDGKVAVISPFLYLNKTDILNLGYSLDPQVPYELTRTCYKDQEYACGKCGSCQERLEAFANISKKDPVNYGWTW